MKTQARMPLATFADEDVIDENVIESDPQRYLWAEELQEREMSDVSKLLRLLSRISPLYMMKYFMQKPSLPVRKFINSGIVTVLSLGMVNLPLHANEFLLDPSPLQTPTVTLQEAESELPPEIAAPKEPTASDFLSEGPLSRLSEEQSVNLLSEPQRPNYYVSASGSDSGDGTLASPWKSLQHAVSSLKAGDTLNIQAGTYQQPAGGAALSASGTSDAYIVIQGLGEVIIEGTGSTMIGGYSVASNFNPAFDTKGHDYIQFRNLTVNNLRAGVEVSPGSSYVEVDGLRANRNHFAVKINGGDHITVRNVVAADNRNAIRTENTGGIVPTEILFENIEVRGSKDVYSGFESRYRNGDGFIFEAGNRITVRNASSRDNWDAGFDIKANNVRLENVIVSGNKNNFKTWGNSIVVINALSYGAKYMTNDPVSGEGNGLNARMGSVRFINSTFVDNESFDIKVDNDGGPANVTFENSIIARKIGGQIFTNIGGSFTDKNNIWHWQGQNDLGLTLGSTSISADPKFVNWDGKDFHLQSSSPSVNFGSSASPATALDIDGNNRIVGGGIDAGAYEYQGGGTAPDTTAPVISAVTSSGITTSGASINWTTSEPGDSQVEYRVKGSTLWQATAVNTVMKTTHSVVLSALTAGTEYEYRVKSTDQAGNLGLQSVVSAFQTLAVTTEPPAPTNCTTPMCGVTDGQTVSGTVKLQPNLTLNPDIRKVAYYLNGTLSSREYTSPFTWGGTGFDTTKLADGSYTLSGAYTTNTGDKNFSLKIVVKNGAAVPVDTTAPVISAVTSSGITTSGASINWTTSEPGDSQVEYRVKGSTLWQATAVNTVMKTTHSVVLSALTAGTEYEYRVKSRDQAGNLGLQSVVSAFQTLAVTTEPPAPTNCTTPMCGVTDGQTVSGTVKVQPNLTLNPDIRKVAYYLNGNLSSREYTSPFTWGGTGFDTTKLADGSYTLSGAYTTNTGDKNFSLKIVVKNGTTVPVDTTAPVISAVTSSGITTSGASINWTTSEPGDSQVEYRVKGSTLWQATAVNTVMKTTHSVVLSALTAGTEYEYRVKSRDQAGNLGLQSVVSAFKTPAPVASNITGVTEGETVSGIVTIGPNLQKLVGIKKVAYYLNGSQSGKVYTSPFYWGGTTGFDTRTLANGTYTLSGAYTTAEGADVSFSVSFKVQN